MYKDKLDYLIGLASVGCGDDDVEMFNNLDTSKVVLDEEFYRVRDRRIRKHKRAPFVKTMRRVLARVAIFILAVVSATTVTVSAIPSLRKAVFNAIVEWYENYLTINYELPESETSETERETDAGSETEADSSEETEENSETESETETEVTRPKEIEEIKKPTYYQDGLFEDLVVQTKNQVIFDYYLGEELFYSYKQIVFNEDEMYVDNESAVVNNIEINGLLAYLVEYTDLSSKEIIWTDGFYIYQLYAVSCDLEILIAVAESIK